MHVWSYIHLNLYKEYTLIIFPPHSLAFLFLHLPFHLACAPSSATHGIRVFLLIYCGASSRLGMFKVMNQESPGEQGHLSVGLQTTIWFQIEIAPDLSHDFVSSSPGFCHRNSRNSVLLYSEHLFSKPFVACLPVNTITYSSCDF